MTPGPLDTPPSPAAAGSGSAPTIPRGTGRSFAGVTLEEAVRRAEDLVPFLREQAAAQEAYRGTTPAVLEALHRSGVIRCVQPARYGGMELEFVSYFDIPAMLARGDASVGWVVANLASHHRTLALFDPRAQEEVWGEDPDALIASGIAYQQGRGRKVDGGIVLSGSWGFSSGVDVAGWNMLACIVRDGDTVLDYRYCLLRRDQYEIVDDWHTLGMCASGSRTARCSEVFVPDHMTLSMHVARPDHHYPGLAVNTSPLFRVPSSALGGHPIGAALVGNARAALETTIELVKSRSTNYTGAKMRDFQTVQLRIGMAGARIDAAHLLMRNDCLEAATICRNGGTIDIETRLRYKRNAAMAAKLCTEAVDSLHEMAGGAGIYDSHPLQRMFRDAHAASAHFSFSLDAQLTPWGLVRLGGEFRSPTL